MTDRFPELARARDFIPDGTVLDGELLVWGDTGPQSIYALQRRIGRKTVPKRLLSEAPVILYAYDLLEWNGVDIRQSSLAERRVTLEKVLNTLPTGTPVKLSPTVPFNTWSALSHIRSTARHASAEGLMLKRRDSSYLTGRRKGDWWKWKLDPLTIDAVMIYAQSGQGRRATLFTDFTFAVWMGNQLIPFTKACCGLTDEEFRKITAWVKQNTQQRFGPVRSVTPLQVSRRLDQRNANDPPPDRRKRRSLPVGIGPAVSDAESISGTPRQIKKSTHVPRARSAAEHWQVTFFFEVP